MPTRAEAEQCLGTMEVFIGAGAGRRSSLETLQEARPLRAGARRETGGQGQFGVKGMYINKE